jgi:hypothetical protein
VNVSLFALTEPKLVQKAKYKLTVLEYVLGINVLNGVVCSVDMRVTVLECCFKDKGSWVSVPSSRTMIRAGIATDTVDAFNIGVL